ncbi:MAG TPA: tetratricopeptide repeat protein [Candidatus Eremiobacteraceae bacterium]|nr:tetratricopeptide repeat protein [Candidatus Eremiobacteraceae bacterium]
MEDPKSRKTGRDLGPAGQQGVGVPAKGDSAADNSSPDAMDGATISDAPATPPAPPPRTKPTTKAANPDATISDSLPATPASSAGRLSGIYMKEAILQPGDLIGARYEILQLLGEGGMGAVYKALDREVERTVALKLIRPELASNPAILARFKQELLTAHQVTHKNVIRIYDIAEAEGVKFITMEFVEGQDLRHILIDHGKLAPEKAVEIIRQVCLALDAAHSAGIIHRDLKPQNIMQEDKTGRILVMDFGLARTIGGDGMTQTGALLGTIEYMSPEQSMGKTLDQRSDIFAVGLIFYELLVGKTPYKADTAMASLLRRNQERAVPAAELDASVPKALSDIVSKCLERDLEHRYQNVQEILQDLDAFQGARPTLASISLPAVAPPPVAKPVTPWKWVGIGALALAVLGGGWALKSTVFHTGSAVPSTNATPKAPEISLAILPFHNATTDTSLDWLGPSLADMLSTDVGQSASLRTVSSDRLHQVLKDLRIPDNTDFDPDTVKRLAEFSNADTLVSGRYAKFGDQIRIDATLQDLKHNRTVPLKIQAASENEIPSTVDSLAEMIRKNLSVSSDVVKELKASSFQPTSKSVEALRDYNQAVAAQRDGKSQDAQKLFEQATKEDPSFALAYSKLAQTYTALGYDDQAEQAARKAVDLSQGLPEAEKYLIAAIHAQIARNFPEAIKSYENLAKAAPGNSDVQAALASLYEDTGDLAKASQYNQAILKANPNDVTAMVAVGRMAINSGKPEAALDPLNRALSVSVQLDNQEQKANVLHLIAFAYLNMNKPKEGLRYYQEELPIWRQLGQKRGIAFSLNGIGRAQASLGENKEGLANFQEALQIEREIGDKRGLGDTLIDMGNLLDDLGDHEQALKMYKEALQVQRDVGNEISQAACLNNIGSIYFEKAQYEDARTYFQQALQFYEKSKSGRDIADALHNLAEISVRTGQLDSAASQYMHALEAWRSVGDTRDAAIESYALGRMFDSQGRFGAAINSKQEALNTFTGLKDKTYWMAEIQSGYGESLILAGRGEEAKTYLNDALSLARELTNDGLVAQTLGFQGDAAYYRGDAKSASSFYEQALQSATRSKEPARVLLPKINIAKVAIQDGHAQQAISSLGSLRQQAEELGLKQISAECSVYMAEAMAQTHDNVHAQQELERALAWADKVGLKPMSAKAHYLLATILRSSGHQSEAQQHYRDVLQLFDDMRKDPGGDKILQRFDVKTMYEEAARWSQTAKN